MYFLINIFICGYESKEKGISLFEIFNLSLLLHPQINAVARLAPSHKLLQYSYYDYGHLNFYGNDNEYAYPKKEEFNINNNNVNDQEEGSGRRPGAAGH